MSGNRKAALLLWQNDGEGLVMLRCLSILLIAAVAGAAVAEQTFVAEFDVAGLSCAGCAATAKKALQQISGVVKADVVFDTRRARIEGTREIEQGEIRRALSQFGFEARFPGDAEVKPLSAEERAGLDISVASRGEEFDIRKHLARGKFTIFDFWAEWCGPCHVLTPKIERLVQQNPKIALRTIDLKQWDSPAGQQATKEFKVAALPYVRVYGPDGTFVGEVLGNDIEKISRLISEQRR